MKLKQTGSVFDNHGLWYYSVQLYDNCLVCHYAASGKKYKAGEDPPYISAFCGCALRVEAEKAYLVLAADLPVHGR